MSILSNSAIIGLLGAPEAAGGGIERSVRFNSSDSAYCSRVPSLAGDRNKYTFSAWTKRSSLSAQAGVFECSPNSNENTGIYFTSSNELRLQLRVFGSYNLLWTTTAIYRDTAAWYHIVVSVDTGQVSTANAVKIYVNGVEQAATYTAASGSYSQNMNTGINSTSSHHIGYQLDGANYFNGYLADIHFIDGQALDPTSFTEVDATTGQLIPKAYSGTYGTNGFHLLFSDNSTAAALGTDTSGNSNTWTVNNISVTAGSGNDSLVDTPTSYGTDTGAGGEVRGNYATWNAIDKSTNVSLSNGNLDTLHGGAFHTKAVGNVYVSSGKWFAEFTLATFGGNVPVVGINSIALPNRDTYVGSETGSFGYSPSALKYSGSAPFGTGYGATFTTGDVIGIALDLDAGTLTFYKNGASQGTAFSGLSGAFTFAASGIASSASWVANFGQRPFAYTAPSGFKALCTTNLPDPVVAKPSDYFNAITYSGNSGDGLPTTQDITTGFSPDFVWIKSRSDTNSNVLFDIIRGAGQRLFSNLTNAESTQAASLVSFNSDGFTVGGRNEVNDVGINYISWTWDAGSSTVTNTDGSITSSVRANPSAGFSIVTYTGTGTTATVGHGLGAAPSFLICKNRNGTNPWVVYHRSISRNGYLLLNTTAAFSSLSDYWGTSEPSSTVVSFDNGGYGGNNFNGLTYVMYAFAPVDGYSNGFSYTGNGSADGSFVYLGFRPRLILLKCSSTTGNWTLVDTAREGYNVDNDPLYPNLANAEGTTDLLDITSNGFKLRTTDASVNSNAATYIGFAWAESPFNYSRAR